MPVYKFILESGDKYVKAFQDAVEKNGSLTMYMAQCMPFGPPSVGKTCLLYRLLNRDAPGEPATLEKLGSGPNSTIVVDNRKMIHIIDDGGDWKEIENLEEVYIKSSTESQFCHENSPVFTSSPVNDSVMPLFPDESKLKAGNVRVRPSPDSYTSTSVTDNSLLNEVLKSMKSKDMTKVKKLLNDTILVSYTDTGGQPEFQEVLPALVAGPTIFVLIFCLAKGLNTKYDVTYRTSDDKSAPYASSFTVKEVFLQCLSSIASYHNALSQDVKHCDFKTIVPPLSVLVVGTYKDLVSDADLKKIDKELFVAVHDFSIHKNGCIEYCPYKDEQLIIPVDNYSNEQNDSNAVKKAVQIIIRRQGEKSPYKIEFPVPWLALEVHLGKLPQSIITYKECIKIAKECNVSEKDLPKCLWFLHHKTGSIRYYHSNEVLKDFIIVKPRVIVKAVSELITNTFICEKVSNPQKMDFKNLGLFKRNTLEQIFKNYRNELQIHVFLTLLEHLYILGPVHDPKFGDYDYFLPCALVHAPDDPSEIALDPLLLVFNGGVVPKGVFSALLVYLLREKEWRIQYVQFKPRLYRNQVYFNTKSNGVDCSVNLKATAECFEVHVESEQARIVSGHEICQILKMGISDVCKHLRYDETFCTDMFGFYCDHPKCTVKHIAEVDSTKKNMTCDAINMSYSVNKKRQYWFKKRG